MTIWSAKNRTENDLPTAWTEAVTVTGHQSAVTVKPNHVFLVAIGRNNRQGKEIALFLGKNLDDGFLIALGMGR